MDDRISTDELQNLLAAATPGPWVFDGNRVKASGRTVSDLRYKNGGNDGLLIATTPELAAEVIRLREEVKRLEQEAADAWDKCEERRVAQLAAEADADRLAEELERWENNSEYPTYGSPLEAHNKLKLERGT